MLKKQDFEQLTQRIEALRGQELTQEERDSISLWEKGRALASMVGFYGWEVILEMQQSYADNAVRQLLAIPPGSERDRIVGAHAAACALTDFCKLFQEDVMTAINASNHTPDVVKAGARIASEVPPESL